MTTKVGLIGGWGRSVCLFNFYCHLCKCIILRLINNYDNGKSQNVFLSISYLTYTNDDYDILLIWHRLQYSCAK